MTIIMHSTDIDKPSSDVLMVQGTIQRLLKRRTMRRCSYGASFMKICSLEAAQRNK